MKVILKETKHEKHQIWRLWRQLKFCWQTYVSLKTTDSWQPVTTITHPALKGARSQTRQGFTKHREVEVWGCLRSWLSAVWMHFLSDEALPMQRQTVGPVWTAADTHIDSPSGSSPPPLLHPTPPPPHLFLPPLTCCSVLWYRMSFPAMWEFLLEVVHGWIRVLVEEVSAACIQAALSEAANRSLVGDKKKCNLCSLEGSRGFTPLFLPVELFKLCRRSEKLRLLLLLSILPKMLI